MSSNNLFRKKSIDRILKEIEYGGGDGEYNELNRVLTVKDITALGIAAIIGAGIFSTVGKACFDGGPAVIFLFIITAIACGFSALSYAEFASRIPVSGSAYTYSYAAFGELIAWIIGWDLILEYAIGNIVVAISWSSNLNAFLDGIGVHIPAFLSTSFMEAKNGQDKYLHFLSQHVSIPSDIQTLHHTWITAPHIGSIPLIINIPAFLIVALITWVVYVGIKESRTSSNLLVAFKLTVIILIIIIGFFYVNPKNWVPFAPNGMSGVMKGVSAVFFAYIGFDAISTTAEECKNPQRDLPLGMIYSLVISTVLYILISLVLTGMVKYTQLNVGDFLVHAFTARGLNWLGGAIAISAVVATTSVLLVFQIGQPRIWMSMSRDGLLPPKFGKIHKKYHTPTYSTIIAGLIVGVPALFFDSNFVTDLTSIGTLFAFVLVCGGILVLPRKEKVKGKFQIPYINGKYLLPILFFIGVILIYIYAPTFYTTLFKLSGPEYAGMAKWEVFFEKLPFFAFLIILFAVMIGTYKNDYNLIPVLGLLSCFYLLSELGMTNWARFIIWLIIGLIIYFSYGRKRSRLNEIVES